MKRNRPRLNAKRLRRLLPALIPVCIGLLLLVGIALLPVSVPQGDDVAITQAKRPTMGIAHDVTVAQEFPATGKAITSLGLLLGTYGRANQGTFTLTIEGEQDGQWYVLAEEAAVKATLRDTAFHTLTFSPPLAVTINQPLQVTLRSADGLDFDNAITWWTDPERTPPSLGLKQPPYGLYVDGFLNKGTACFTVTYPRASGHLFQVLAPLWGRVTIFLNPRWPTMLLVALGLFAASFLVIGQRVPDGAPAPRSVTAIARLIERGAMRLFPAARKGREGEGVAAARTLVYSSTVSSGVGMRLRALVERRDLIWELTARNLKVRYRRSVFGFLWAILNPLLYAIVFSFVFRILLKSPIERFPLFVVVGILTWNAFSASVLESMSVITGSASLVTRVRFPHEVLPISTVLANLINFVFALPSIFLVMAITHTPLYPQVVLFPWVLVCLSCFSLGIAFMAAATNVFFRDTRNFLDVLITLWFFLTPIIYNLDAVFVEKRGQRLVYWLNPMASVLTLFRHMFYTGYWDAPSFLLRTSVACFAVLVGGWLFFVKLSGKFVEEL